jgi:hypothetical protein
MLFKSCWNVSSWYDWVLPLKVKKEVIGCCHRLCGSQYVNFFEKRLKYCLTSLLLTRNAITYSDHASWTKVDFRLYLLLKLRRSFDHAYTLQMMIYRGTVRSLWLNSSSLFLDEAVEVIRLDLTIMSIINFNKGTWINKKNNRLHFIKLTLSSNAHFFPVFNYDLRFAWSGTSDDSFPTVIA